MSHEPHHRIEHRRKEGVHTTEREHTEHMGFNGWLATLITKGFGSMWAFYVLVVWMFAWMFLATIGFWLFQYDKYPFTFLLFLSNLVQLWALPVLAVGQQVLSRASDRQARQTYLDAEAILHISDDVHKLVKLTNDDTVKILAAIANLGQEVKAST